MVELYSDLSNGVWRVVMQQNGGRGRVEYSRMCLTIDWHLGGDGKIVLDYPDTTFENFVPKYVLAKIAAMCKVAYQWHSLKRSGVEYGVFGVSDEDIDALENHGYDFLPDQIAELKASKEKVNEIATEILMQKHWMETLGEAANSLFCEEIET